jgi:hypothetical protein
VKGRKELFLLVIQRFVIVIQFRMIVMLVVSVPDRDPEAKVAEAREVPVPVVDPAALAAYLAAIPAAEPEGGR